MATTVIAPGSSLLARPVADTPEDREEFSTRRRILVLEPDPALRRVLAGALLRLGCVVSFKSSLAAVLESLSPDVDGVIAALDADLSPAARLRAAAPPGTRLAVLSHAPPDPKLARSLPAVAFLQKPFDLRDLLAALNVPERAQIIKRD